MSRPLPKQFLLARHEIDMPTGWTSTPFADRILCTSPELPITWIRTPRARGQSAPIGCILGWFVYQGTSFPSADTTCLRTGESIRQVYEQLTGRFVIMTGDAENFQCITDPGGLLPVVFRLPTGDIASTPRALELAAPIVIDKDRLEGFVRRDNTVWYPFGVTPFKDIDRVLPGRSLELPSGAVTLFAENDWPGTSLQDSIDYLFVHSSNFVTALSKRGEVDAHLTAGWDSRMVLSAALNCSDSINFLTYRTGGSTGDVDCQIARKIAKKFSLRHREIPVQATSQRELDDWQWRTADCIVDSVMHLTKTVANTDSGNLVLCGLAGEVGRAFYWRPGDVNKAGLNAQELLNLLGFFPTPMAIDLGERWLNAIAHLPTGMILDQAYIDLRLGGWGGPSIYGHPVGKPTLTPFNNSVAFSAMKALPQNYRLTGQFPRDFISRGSKTLAEMPVNRARGIRRVRYLKNEIIAKLPPGAKTKIKTLIASRGL